MLEKLKQIWCVLFGHKYVGWYRSIQSCRRCGNCAEFDLVLKPGEIPVVVYDFLKHKARVEVLKVGDEKACLGKDIIFVDSAMSHSHRTLGGHKKWFERLDARVQSRTGLCNLWGIELDVVEKQLEDIVKENVPQTIMFYSDKQMVGVLYFKDGVLRFAGKADKSAVAFLDVLKKHFIFE
jgi:hypothetical protein